MGVVRETFLAVMFFCPDVVAGNIQRVVQTLEFTGVDETIGAEAMLQSTNFSLFVHQVTEFVTGQTACTPAVPDTFHLLLLASVDLLDKHVALPDRVTVLAMAVTVPVCSGTGCHQAKAAKYQNAQGLFSQIAFHGVAPVQLRDAAFDLFRQRTPALWGRHVSRIFGAGNGV
jgi:hypothetical protein